jgi:hypothetical protein
MYAADIWFTNVCRPNGSFKRLGSVKVIRKLTSAQHRVTKLVTGALSTTAGDILEAHANLLSIDLLLNKITFRAATRITSLTPSSLYPVEQPKDTSSGTALHFTTSSASSMSTPTPLKLSHPHDISPLTPQPSPPPFLPTNLPHSLRPSSTTTMS